MGLGALGIISAVVVAIYVPLFIFALRIVLSSQDTIGRWVGLPTCILCRLAGSALFIATELHSPAQPLVYILCFALDVSSSWVLVFCTLNLIEIIREPVDDVLQRQSSSGHFEVIRTRSRNFRSLAFQVVVTLIPLGWMAIFLTFALWQLPSGWTISAQVGPLLVAFFYIFTVMWAVGPWFHLDQLLHYRKQLLFLVTVALPLIAIRTVYGALSVFSPGTAAAMNMITNSADRNSLAKFSMFAGDFRIYFVMDVLMECVVVIMYTVAGFRFPLDEDYRLVDGYPFPRIQHLGDSDTP